MQSDWKGLITKPAAVGFACAAESSRNPPDTRNHPTPKGLVMRFRSVKKGPGTRGRTRTDKMFPSGDFESPASTNSATRAPAHRLAKLRGSVQRKST
jgi:hypothetical protein